MEYKMKRILFGMTTSRSVSFLGRVPAELAASGWEVFVVASGAVETQTPDEEERVTFISLNMVRKISLFHDFASFCRWFFLLLRIKPTVIAVGTPKASFLAVTAAFFARVPVRTYLLYGLRLETASGLTRLVLLICERVLTFFSTEILAVSRSLRLRYAEFGLASEDEITVLGSGSSKGVDLNRFRPPRASEVPHLFEKAKSIGLSGNVPVIGLFGRHSIDKGLDLFLEAISLLDDSKLPFELLLVGEMESPPGLLDKLSDRNCRFVSLPWQGDIELYYRLIDILCFPSRREGLPNSILEASASGVAVVVTPATGTVDAVEHEIGGLVTESFEAQAIADSLIKLLKAPELAEQLGSQGRKWVESRFEEGNVTELQLSFFKQQYLFGERRRSGKQPSSASKSTAGRSFRKHSSIAR